MYAIGKKIIGVLAAAALAIPVATEAQELRWQVVADNYDRLQIDFSADLPEAGKKMVCGRTFGTFALDGCIASNEAGRPALPLLSRMIEVPLCEGYEVTVSDAEYDTLAAAALGLQWPLMPAQPDRRKSDTTRAVLTMDDAVYAADAYYALPLAAVEPVGVARDRNLARLRFSPVSYNPATGQVAVCRHATVTIAYRGADAAATKHLFERYYTPAFVNGAQCLNDLYPKTASASTPVRYTIVAHSMFRGYLDSFVQWKRRKGFLVDELYTDNPAVGATSTSIASYLAGLYAAAGSDTATLPAPSYVLLVGDVAQVPPFVGVTDTEHVTDLYFATWTAGDNVPDCHYGRFSARTIAELMPQVEKTLMYEQYTFADPTFLDRAVLVAGVDHGEEGDYGYTHADPAMDYAIINYINPASGFSDIRYFKNDPTIVPVAGVTPVKCNESPAAVRDCYDMGASFINYSAHGSPTCWGTPYFGVEHVAQMKNTQKFGLMIGNCCQTNTFQEGNCLGEALLRRGEYSGAVGYIGGSNSTYWGSDFDWAVGLRYGVGPTMSMAYNASHRGAYDAMFHTHGEAYSKWAISQGSIIMVGNMAVQSNGNAGTTHYYWEIYHLMGDPSVMPYLRQAREMTVEVSPVIIAGSSELHVSAEPHAYVALTQGNTLVAAAFANGSGDVTLSLPTTLALGGYELAVTASQCRPVFRQLTVVDGSQPLAYVSCLVAEHPLDVATEETMTMTVAGSELRNTRGVVLTLFSDNPNLALNRDTMLVGTVPAQSELTLIGLSARVLPTATDGEVATVSVIATWDSCQDPMVTRFQFILHAPAVSVEYPGTATMVPRGGTSTVCVKLTNKGHAAVNAADLVLVPPTALVNVLADSAGAVLLPYGASVVRTFSVSPDNSLADGTPIQLSPMLLPQAAGYVPALNSMTELVIGVRDTETFEGSTFHVSGWQNGSNPWIFDDTMTYAGSRSLRSANGLTHNQSSTISMPYNIPLPDSLVFYYKVSSESNYDKLRVKVDDDLLLETSGEVGWKREALAVPAGSHTISFTYAKDYSESRGSDCAWIDNVVFPFARRVVTFRTDHVCVGDSYALFGSPVDTDQPIDSVIFSPDSLTIVDYHVHPQSVIMDTVTACDSYVMGGIVYNQSTDVVSILTSEYGCDSTVMLNLTIVPSVIDTVSVATAPYEWNGVVYEEEGSYVRYLTNEQGCDSVVVLRLTTGVGIPMTNTMNVTIYPNPTTGWISFGEVVDAVVLYDNSGRMIEKKNVVDRMNISTLPAGVYLLKVSLHGMESVVRVVRQ